MGIVSSIVVSVAKKKAKETLINITADLIGESEADRRADKAKTIEKYENGLQKMCKKHPRNIHLWMSEDGIVEENMWMEDKKYSKYTIKNMSGETEYFASGRNNKKLQKISISSSDNIPIGEISENMFLLRGTHYGERMPVDYTIDVFGSEKGKVKSRIDYKHSHFDVTFNGWIVEYKVFGDYRIIDKQGHIKAEIKSKIRGDARLTFMDIYEKKDEVLIVFLVLMVRAYELSCERKSS